MVDKTSKLTGNKVAAVKRGAGLTGAGLRLSKDHVEGYCDKYLAGIT